MKNLLFENHESSQAFRIITQKSLLLDISFLWKLFPGHHFHKILRFCMVVLGEGCSKTRMKVTGISLCVVLVSPYSVQELPSSNCIRRYSESDRLV